MTDLNDVVSEAMGSPNKAVDIGRNVYCDACSTDYTESSASGGILVGSYAYCPECTKRRGAAIEKDEPHLIRGRCPEGTSFADWCRTLRGGNNTIRVTTFPRHNSLEDLAGSLVARMGDERASDTMIASDHVYSCRCDSCLVWWAHLGPDGGDAGDYGPFTKEEVNAKQRELNLEVTE